MFFSSSTTSTVRGAGVSGDALATLAMGGTESVMQRRSYHAAAAPVRRSSAARPPDVIEVVSGLDNQGTLLVLVDDEIEGLPRFVPLVHPEVRLPEEQERLRLQARIGPMRHALGGQR